MAEPQRLTSTSSPPKGPVRPRDASSNIALSTSSREREVFRLLEPWRRQSSHLFRPVSFKPGSERPTPLGADDTALSAFAQLGAFRLKAQRCMIVLFGREHEYVLAESTQTLSLQSDAVHSVADGLWIGTASFASDEGLAETLLPTWMAEASPRKHVEPDFYHTAGLTPSYLVVNDMRQHKDYQRVLPAFNSRIRFLVAIPIRSHRGHLVGAYIVLDNAPRYGVSDVELSFLEDMSRTVHNHLSATRAAAQKQDAQRLIKGLSVFTQGGRSLRDWWYEEYDAEQRRSRKQDQQLGTQDENRERKANEDLGDKVNDPAEDGSSNVVSPTEDIGREVSATTRLQDTQVHDFATQGSQSSETSAAKVKPGSSNPARFDLGAATSLIFSRASNLIREAMNADGVLFLDAGFTQSRTTAASHERRYSRVDELQDVSSNSENSNQSGEGTSHTSSGGESASWHGSKERRKQHRSKRRLMRCDALGYCTRVKSSINIQDVPQSLQKFSQRRMEKLLDKYPSGKIFNFAEDGSFETSSSPDDTDRPRAGVARGRSTAEPTGRASGESDASSIQSLCNGARSVVFLPLWDAHREKWRSGAFVWTNTPGKYFTRDEDLTYLLAFADNVAGSMTRLDMMASDQAKSTFISTISHELRSPLHGVLAGSEYLLSTSLTSTQHEMAMTVKIAAGSLLDTINGMLDFTKINGSTRADQAARGPIASKEAHLQGEESDHSDADDVVDVAELTENVVNTVVAAHHHLSRNRSNASQADLDRQAVQIILDIADRRGWTMRMSSGPWTRIMTNLIGNALKYTKAGYVHVKLDAVNEQVNLTVQDTGAGISEEYQKHHLYTAFQQEDPLISGTGLGLYIVKQLVTDLRGTVTVESSTQADDRGTKIMVSVPILFPSDQPPRKDPQLPDFDGPVHQIALLTRSPVWTTSARDSVRATRSGMLKASIRRTCRDWLHASFANVERIEDAESSDICLMLESEFAEWWDKVGHDLSKIQQLPHLTVLAERYGGVLSRLEVEDLAADCTFVDPPFGPRKLARVLELALRGQTPIASPQSGPAMRRFPGRGASLDDNQQQNRPRRRGEEAARTEHSPVKAGKKVLLVEDNDLNMRLLVAWSRRLGVSYVESVNGLEAVQAYMADPLSFDLVVMDISMPIMDGFTATSEIRSHEHRRRIRACKIVALTGVASEDARADAAKAGVDDFIVKPASLAKLQLLFESEE